MQNRMELHFSSCPQNESFARVAIAAFAVQLNPTLPEMADIKTAVSEAVTNAIVHGYRDQEGMVSLCAEYGDRRLLTVRVHDDGCGIEDVPAAMQPFYSTGDGNERSGMGFCVMQTFMDAVEVESAVGKGRPSPCANTSPVRWDCTVSECWTRSAEGNRAHFGLAVACAKRFQGRGVPMEELIGEAEAALLWAAARFDEKRGARFSTYAIPFALGALRELCRRNAPMNIPGRNCAC